MKEVFRGIDDQGKYIKVIKGRVVDQFIGYHGRHLVGQVIYIGYLGGHLVCYDRRYPDIIEFTKRKTCCDVSFSLVGGILKKDGEYKLEIE